MKKLALATVSALLTIVAATPASAQDGGRSIGSYSKEVAFQYSMLRDIGEIGPLGVLVDFGKAVKPGISIVAEFNLHRFTDMEENYTQAAAGVRFGRMAGSKSRVFVQMLVGPQNSFGSTGIAYQPGVGFNTRLKGRVDAKVQVDAPIVRWHNRTYKQARVSVGLGFALGGR